MLPQDNVEPPAYATVDPEPMNNLDVVGAGNVELMTVPSSPERSLHRNIFGAG